MSSGQAQTLTLNWDFDNRLSEGSFNKTATDYYNVNYKFDALGRRVYRRRDYYEDGDINSGTLKNSKSHVYEQSGRQTIADYTAGAAPTTSLYRYVYGATSTNQSKDPQVRRCIITIAINSIPSRQ